MPSDLIIRGGLIVRVDSAEIGDLVIDGGKIVEAGPSVSGVSRAEIDATGLTIFPGLIDSHVHFNEPGRTEWEGIASGSAALVAGGGTCFFDMPLNSSPPVLDAESFDLKLAAANAKSLTDFGLWGGLVPGNLDRLEELAERGVVGFKAFMSNSGIADFQSVDDLSLYRGMQKAKALGLLDGRRDGSNRAGDSTCRRNWLPITHRACEHPARCRTRASRRSARRRFHMRNMPALSRSQSP